MIEEQRIRQRIANRKCYQKNKPRRLEHTKNYQRHLKIKVFTHYSKGTPKCACCGEKEIKFLSVDHINNGGAKHRKELGIVGGGIRFYFWLQKNKLPEGFQILCHNCNQAKGSYGICPHKELLK